MYLQIFTGIDYSAIVVASLSIQSSSVVGSCMQIVVYLFSLWLIALGIFWTLLSKAVCKCSLVNQLVSNSGSYFSDWMDGMVTEYLVATFADYFGDVKL
jgi:hypothetical protein